jgi:magnesium transporter
MGKISFRRSVEPGLPPGTLVHVGEKRQKKVTVELISYNEEDCKEEIVNDLDKLKELPEEGRTAWINVNGLHDADIMKRIGDLFSIHPLVMEDIMNTDQRSKSEAFSEHLFIVLKMVKRGVKKGNGIEQISLVLGKGYVISFQEWKGDVFDPIRKRLRTKIGRIRSMGADYLAYTLIDAVVDNYFPVLEEIGNEIEEMEIRLNKKADDEGLKRIHSIKRRLIQIRRSIWPMRDVINGVLREESYLMGQEVKPYLRDVYDHTIQVMDTLESMRDMATGLMDLYISLVSNRMNEIMKLLTVIATIFIPLTFIAGVYGMNFDPDSSPLNMPELEWYYGYPLIMASMLLIAIGMVVYFKRKKWL